MFNKNNQKVGAIEAGSVNLIGNGTKIVGDISSTGDVRIDGHLQGNLQTSGKFVLGANGVVDGNVNCGNADLSGEIRGKVNITELLLLKSTAKVLGDIITGKLAIESGAMFTGTCNMGAKVKNMQPVSAERTELNGAAKSA
jgi:cytoskeletal protein CcmA (bactofilin family)